MQGEMPSVNQVEKLKELNLLQVYEKQLEVLNELNSLRESTHYLLGIMCGGFDEDKNREEIAPAPSSVVARFDKNNRDLLSSINESKQNISQVISMIGD